MSGFGQAHKPASNRFDRMRLAFAVMIARRIVDADGVLDLAEIELLSRTFPTATLREAGFLDHQELLSSTIELAYRDAVAELPRFLTLSEKLDLVTLFHRTADADGSIHPRELGVLRDAAVTLQIPAGTLEGHLTDLRGTTLVPLERR